MKRFYVQAVGATRASSWTGDAFDYFGSAGDKKLVSNANGALTPPAPGDILVFSGPNSYGHVAIVTRVMAPQISFIEQNWSVTGAASLSISNTCSVAGCSFTVANRVSYPKSNPSGVIFPVVGWLREPLPSIPITIDFEQFTGPHVFTGIQPPLTIGNATFYGGQLLKQATNLAADQSTVYGTASPYCPTCLPAVTIAFAQRVSNFSAFLINGNTVTVTYTVRDDQGGSQTKTLAANFLEGAGTVSLLDSNIQSITITSGPAPGGCCGWDFFIDNVTFTPVAVP